MKKFASMVVILAVLTMSSLGPVGMAAAEEIKMVGTISSIQMAADQKSATVVLKDVKSGADVSVVITDDTTLDKFKDKKIVEGDEVRCKYDNQGGKNASKMFKKTAGC